ISYRRPLCLLSVEKARSFSSTSILITKCACTRRFFWRRPRPMPRNDPQGNAPRFKGVVRRHYAYDPRRFALFEPVDALLKITAFGFLNRYVVDAGVTPSH